VSVDKALFGAAMSVGMKQGMDVVKSLKSKRMARATFAPPLDVKAFDLAYTNSFFTTAGTFTTLNVPVNGSEQYQRVGRRIFLRSLQIKGVMNFAATSVQDVCRIMVVYDHQPNAALPVLADLIQNSNAGLATQVLSYPNLNNRDRFTILKDYKIMLPPFTNTAGVITNEVIPDPIRNSMNIDWDIRLGRRETTFNAVNGGTIADVTTGSIFMVTFDGNNAGTVALSFQSRLRYVD